MYRFIKSPGNEDGAGYLAYVYCAFGGVLVRRNDPSGLLCILRTVIANGLSDCIIRLPTKSVEPKFHLKYWSTKIAT